MIELDIRTSWNVHGNARLRAVFRTEALGAQQIPVQTCKVSLSRTARGCPTLLTALKPTARAQAGRGFEPNAC
ncbi:MAG TPA: hypothetical protein VFR73_06420, partial [Hyphomicrobiaceae bacterium]|nr:hypothetical protein [Hyphomicrobiaceae bacterium]